MLKAAGIGALALATGMVSLASAQQWGAGAPAASASAHATPAAVDPRRPVPGDSIITQSHVAKLRATLKLTPAQQAYWAPVEAALHDLARQQARGEAAGFSHRLTNRGAAVTATMTQLRRLRSVAIPLIRSLDENQKRDAMNLARSLGFEQLVAAF